MNGDSNGSAVGLFLLEALNVHNPLGTVHLHNAALRATRRTTHDSHLVVLTDRD